MRSTTISSVPKASGPTGTAQRARKKPTSALVVLLLASAPRAGQPFLFPGKTSCPGAGGAAPTTDQVDGARLLRGSGSGSPLRGGALSGPDRQGAAGLGGVKPGGRAEVERVEEGAGGGAGDDGASKSRGREAGFGTRARSPAVGRRRKAWTNEAGSSALGSAARSKASTEVQEDSGPSQSSHAVEPQEEDRLSAAGVPTAGELLVKAREMFEEMFGEPADSREVSAGYAPGRVNLIGEHTDYNGGFVMPLALDRGTVLYGTGRLIDAPEQGAEEACCRVMSESVMLSESGEMGLGDVTFRADASLTPGEPEWANYVKGVVKEYMGKIPEGKTLAFKAIVVSTVPIGGGVSSSASLCVATATFLDGVLKSAGVVPPSPKEKAHMCRMAEHRFMNMPCGIMDQFVTSMAEAGHAMLLDCRSEDPEDVPLMDPGLVIVVTNSNVKHKLAGSQYPVRVAQCEVARDELRKRHPEVELLRDASREQVEEIQGEVEQAVFRRARHVVSENSRTVAAAEALGKKDYGAAGRYMLESHASLREDYEVSCPEIDALVELAMEVEGVYGSRLTGGGFGGCTVTLADKDSVETLVGHLREGYQRSMGKDCSCFVTQPGFGARGLTGAAALSASKWPNT